MAETVGLIIGIGDPILNRVARFIERCITFNALPQSFENIRQEFDSAREQFDTVNRSLRETPLPEDISNIVNIDTDAMKTAVTNINATVRNLQNHFPDSGDNIWPKCWWILRFARTRSIASRLSEIRHLVIEMRDYVRHATLLLRVEAQAGVENHEDCFKSLVILPRDDKNVLTDFSPEARDEGRIESVAKSHIVEGNSAITAICGLYGMGGVGKTTSMIALGHDPDVQRCFPDGVHFMKFGQGATEDEIVREFARIVELSGGNKVSQKIKSTKSIRDAVQQTTTWFQGRKVLFLCDDIWPMVSSAKGIMAELRNLSAAPGICVVVTTRDQYIANEADDQIPCSPLKPQSDISRSILLIRAGVSKQEYESSSDHTKHLVNLILDKCGGIPLTLTIAGASIHFLVQNREMRWKDALADHCRKLEENEINAGDANPLFQKYPSFRSTVLSSLQIADGWSTRHCTENCIVPFQCSSLFKRLCILRKKSSINDFVLTKIWNELHASDVSIVAERLLSLRLIQPEGDGFLYSLHDLVLEFCVDEGKKGDTFRANAVSVLSAYMSPADFQSDWDRSIARMSTEGLIQITRCWWNLESIDDHGFLYVNLARLLVHAGLHMELVGLLKNARWFLIRQKNGGILALQQDFKQLIDKLRLSQSKDLGVSQLMASLKILQRSVIAMSNAVERNVQELATQSHARLLDLHHTSSVAVQRFLQTALERTPKPYLLPQRRCWPDEHATTVPLRDSCYFIGAAADNQIVRAHSKGFVHEIDFQTEGAAVCNTIQHPSDGLRCRSMSPDGTVLVLCGSGRNIVFWNVNTRQIVWETATDDDFSFINTAETTKITNSVAWDPSGRIFVLCGQYGMVQLFDLSKQTQKILKDISNYRTFDPHAVSQTNLQAVAVSLGCGRVVAGGMDGTLRCWEVKACSDVASSILWRCEAHSKELGVRTVFMNEDGTCVASGGASGLKLWNGDNGTIKEFLKTFLDYPVAGTFCAGGDDLIMSTSSGNVQWHNALSGQLTSEFDAPKGCNLAIVARNGGQQAVCAGEDGMVRMWNRDDSLVSGKVPLAHVGPILDLSMSLNGVRLLTVGIDFVARLWDWSGTRCIAQLCRRDERIRCADMSADGQYVVTGNLRGGLAWWNSSTGQFIRAHDGAHVGMVMEVAVSKTGSDMISLGGDHILRCWNGRTMAFVASHSISDMQTSKKIDWLKSRLVVSWNGCRFAITVGANIVMCAAAEPGGAVTRVRAEKWGCMFLSVKMSGNGMNIATGDEKGGVQVWAWGGQRPIWENRKAHKSSQIWGVALSENARWIVSGGNDGVLRLWRETRRAGAGSGAEESVGGSAAENGRRDDGVCLEASSGCAYNIFTEATVPAAISQVAISQIGEVAEAKVAATDESGRVWIHKLVMH